MSDYSDDKRANIIPAEMLSDYSDYSDYDITNVKQTETDYNYSDYSEDETEPVNNKSTWSMFDYSDYSEDETEPVIPKQTVEILDYSNDKTFIESYGRLISYSSDKDIPPIVERLISFFKDGNKSKYSKRAIYIFIERYYALPEEYRKDPVIFGTFIDIIKDSSDFKQQMDAIIRFIEIFDHTYNTTHGRDKSLEYDEEYKKIIMDNLKVFYDAISNIIDHLRTEYENNPKDFKYKYSSIRDLYEALPKILRRKRLKKLYRLIIPKKWW